jgi:predicted RNase H-like HicB family nuclease
MLFFGPEGNTTSAGDYSTGKDLANQLKTLSESIQSFVGPKMKEVFKNLSQEMVSIENTSKSLQKNMGGVAFNTQNFTQQLYEAYKVNMDIGATFKDSADVLQGMSGEMGRMVGTSTENLSNMVLFSKLAGMSSESVGKMVAEMIRYGGSQAEALEEMNKMRTEAIKLGLNANKFITDVNANLKKLSGFGFKDGVKGLTNMVKQAQLLRSSIENIGAASLQSKILDPEGAIEAAAGFQMLGGAVGKLGDPFQLLYMAQSDMAGLQDELVKSTKAAYTFNKSTGQFEASTQDLYRLREQASITGADFEKMAEAGREAAKLDFIQNAVDLSNVSDESKGLIASLSTIQKGTGKVEVNVPGFDSQGQTLDEILNNAGKKAELDQALAEYQQKMQMTDKQLAIDQLTIAQNQAIDVRTIKESILRNMSPEERKSLENTIKNSSEKMGDVAEKAADKGASAGISAAKQLGAAYGDKDKIMREETAGEKRLREEQEAKQNEIDDKIVTKQGSDMLFKPGDAPQLLAKDTLYKGIVGDEVAIGTNLTDALNKGGGLGGKIDININLNGSIGGDPGQINKMFNSPEVQKQIMDTVLYKLNEYKRQQGVLS